MSRVVNELTQSIDCAAYLRNLLVACISMDPLSIVKCFTGIGLP